MQPHVSQTDIALQPSPINAEWVRQGTPVARNRVLFRSQDRTATTIVWDCTAGSFDWFYTSDETIHVLEGRATLTFDSQTRVIKPGDVVFFPAGSQARWVVDDYIRKLAFFRRTLPLPVSLAMRALGRARSLLAVRKPQQPAMAGL